MTLGSCVLTLYKPGYFHPLFVPGGGGKFAFLSKSRLVSDRSKIFYLLKLFFVKFLKINILKLWLHEDDDDIIKTSCKSKPVSPYSSMQICLNVAKYDFQFELLLFQRHL